MSEHPILFNGDMVRAILDGRKTQTRRIIKPQPDDLCEVKYIDPPQNAGFNKNDLSEVQGWCEFSIMDDSALGYQRDLKCPFGKVGDSLWVRENFYRDTRELETDRNPALIYAATPEWFVEKMQPNIMRRSLYRPAHNADGPTRAECEANLKNHKFQKLKPSIHMPRWASRLSLPVISIRAERIQDISEKDALAEGIEGPFDVGYKAYRIPGDSKPRYSCAVAAFESLWRNIYGSETWDSSVWVWVAEWPVFK